MRLLQLSGLSGEEQALCSAREIFYLTTVWLSRLRGLFGEEQTLCSASEIFYLYK